MKYIYIQKKKLLHTFHTGTCHIIVMIIKRINIEKCRKLCLDYNQ